MMEAMVMDIDGQMLDAMYDSSTLASDERNQSTYGSWLSVEQNTGQDLELNDDYTGRHKNCACVLDGADHPLAVYRNGNTTTIYFAYSEGNSLLETDQNSIVDHVIENNATGMHGNTGMPQFATHEPGVEFEDKKVQGSSDINNNDSQTEFKKCNIG